MMRASRSFSIASSAAADVRVDKKEKRHPKKKALLEKPLEAGGTLDTVGALPMVIPKRVSLRPALSDGEVNTRRSLKRASVPTRAKSDSLNPAIAAVLSSTAIPSRRRPSLQVRKAVSLGAVVEEREKESALEQSRTALDILLSPPEDDDDEEEILGGLVPAETRKTFLRQKSTESVPSLDTDDESISSCSLPSTPRSGASGRKTNAGGWRVKQMSSPTAQDCLSDHPLLFASVDPQLDLMPALPSESDLQALALASSKSTSRKRKTSLKSNLTASLRVLKSAAKQFSNFNPPLTHPDDFLTRSILSISPQYTDEKRPLPLSEEPTPALRRYLNPSPVATTAIKSRERRLTPLGALPELPEEVCTASIQLQTYRVSKSAKKAASAAASAPPAPVSATASSSSSSPLLAGPTGRQREVRENCDFLRVIVLEMNMRREGKLMEYAHGKARFVLPPRQVTNLAKKEEAGSLPSRWIAIVYDEDSDCDSDTDSDSDSS